MNLPKFGTLSMGLVVLAACSISASPAKNPIKNPVNRLQNVPLLVAASCLNKDSGVSAGFTFGPFGSQIRVIADAAGWSGFEVFGSEPGAHNGHAINDPPGTYPAFPAADITFTESGLPAGGAFNWFALYSDGTFVVSINAFPNASGQVTIPTGQNNGQAQGASLRQVQVYVQTVTGSSSLGDYATVNMSNFHLGSSALLLDTSFTDHGVVNVDGKVGPFSYCI